jgi:hypothetical protein
MYVTYASFPFLSFPPLASFLGAFFFPPLSAAAAAAGLAGMLCICLGELMRDCEMLESFFLASHLARMISLGRPREVSPQSLCVAFYVSIETKIYFLIVIVERFQEVSSYLLKEYSLLR